MKRKKKLEDVFVSYLLTSSIGSSRSMLTHTKQFHMSSMVKETPLKLEVCDINTLRLVVESELVVC